MRSYDHQIQCFGIDRYLFTGRSCHAHYPAAVNNAMLQRTIEVRRKTYAKFTDCRFRPNPTSRSEGRGVAEGMPRHGSNLGDPRIRNAKVGASSTYVHRAL